jgi:hypothetical protein
VNWLEQQVRALGVRKLAVAGVLLVIILLVLGGNSRYYINYVKGPTPMDRAQLDTVRDVEALDRYWVRLEVDRVVDTGVEEISVRKKRGVERSRSVSGRFYAALVGERLLLIKGHGGMPSNTLTGTLVPAQSNIIAELTKDPKTKDLASRFYPVMLDDGNFKSSGTLGLWVAGLAALAALVWGLLNLGLVTNPAKNALVTRMETFGGADKHSDALQKELSGDAKLKVDGVTFTRSYAVKQSLLKFDVHRLESLLWSYKAVTQHKMWGIIPTGKTFALSVNFPEGALQIKGKEDKLDQLMTALANIAPWAAFGYDDNLKHLYDKKRAELQKMVRDNKQRMMAPPPPAPAPAPAPTQAGPESNKPIDDREKPLDFNSR